MRALAARRPIGHTLSTATTRGGKAVPATATRKPADVQAADPLEARVARIRELAETDPAAAQAEAWAWFVEAGRRIQRDRSGAVRELGELFRAGEASTGIDGETEGTLVGFTITPGLDRTLAAFSSAWLPWAGKRFDTAAASGDNLLLRSARLPSKLLWPRYRMRDAGRRIAAFNFETRVEPGALDTDRDVLVIDYAAVSENPLLIKRIRDELVEIVPGAHLGKMLWRHGQGERHTLLAYFALKTPPAV